MLQALCLSTTIIWRQLNCKCRGGGVAGLSVKSDQPLSPSAESNYKHDSKPLQIELNDWGKKDLKRNTAVYISAKLSFVSRPTGSQSSLNEVATKAHL